MKYAVVSVLAMLLTACAGSPSERLAREVDQREGVICTYDVPTGSSIRERKCTTPEERADQRRQAEHQVVLEPGRGNAR